MDNLKSDISETHDRDKKAAANIRFLTLV